MTPLYLVTLAGIHFSGKLAAVAVVAVVVVIALIWLFMARARAAR